MSPGRLLRRVEGTGRICWIGQRLDQGKLFFATDALSALGSQVQQIALDLSQPGARALGRSLYLVHARREPLASMTVEVDMDGHPTHHGGTAVCRGAELAPGD